MFSTSILTTLATAALTFSNLAQASTAACNPLTAATSCSPDKALATSFAEDFNTNSSWFNVVSTSDEVFYTDDGLKLTLAKRFDNPSLKSDFYIMYGKLEVIFKAAEGTGIVSSFYLQSDDLDEVDLEWLGGDDTQVQSNYFSKGNTSTYDRGAYHSVNSPQTTFHNYTIDWQMEQLVWYIDGVAVRTLKNDTSNGYPQSPMYVMMGIWAGGDPSNEPGTIEWAGGETDYSKAPFSMYVKRVVVSDYSSGSEYIYTDKTGSWTSIEAKGGSINGRFDKANDEFDALVDGGSISSESSSYSSTSSSSSSTSSASPSSSTTSAPASSTTSSSSLSSKIHDGLSSSRSRVETVYRSGASSLKSSITSRIKSTYSSLVTRDSDSSEASATPTSDTNSTTSSSTSTSSTFNSSTTLTTATKTDSDGSLDSDDSSNGTSSSKSTHSVSTHESSASAPLSTPVGLKTFKAIITTIGVASIALLFL